MTNQQSELCEESTPHASIRVEPKGREHHHRQRGETSHSSSQGR